MANVRTALEQIHPLLNASGWGDLGFWTEAELFEYAQRAAERTAQTVFGPVAWSSTNTAVASVALPANHVKTLAVFFSGSRLMQMDGWEFDGSGGGPAEDPTWWVEDQRGTAAGEIVAAPNAPGDLQLFYRSLFEPIDTGTVTITGPQVIADSIAFEVLAVARSRESEGAMLEVEAAALQRASLYRQIFKNLWGMD